MEGNQTIRVFLDTNILISGIFFSGVESKLLSLSKIEFITSDIAVSELKEVVMRKFVSIKAESKRITFQEIDRALGDFRVIKENEYRGYIGEASRFVKGRNDRKILAAVLFAKPDYFITGDKHFHTEKIKEKVEVKHTQEVLKELRE